MAFLTVIPAYGRDYKSAKEVKQAFNDGKDFIVADFFNPYNGMPCSIRELSGYTVNIRYKKLTQIAQVKVK